MVVAPESLRSVVVESARRLTQRELSHGTSGNLSVRSEGGFLITPTAMPYDELRPEQVVAVTLAGEVAQGERTPSTEWPFHAAIYAARPEAGAVVHAHPPYATALSCVRREIPAFHYMVGIAGGHSIRCAGYAKPGSERLASLVLDALEDRRACLMSNHGLVTLGSTLDEAFDLALEVESLARQYSLALQVGQPVLLTDEEMDLVLRHFESYRAGRE